jgi:hypothetical protein
MGLYAFMALTGKILRVYLHMACCGTASLLHLYFAKVDHGKPALVNGSRSCITQF